MMEPHSPLESRWVTAGRAIAIGLAVLFAGTLPRNVLFAMNLSHFPEVPWALPLVGTYLWLFWGYLSGKGPPAETAKARYEGLRARRVSPVGWLWALLAGGLGIAALVASLHVINRLVVLPEQQLPDLTHMPRFTILSLLIAAVPIAAIVEESAFRGYMQGPIERCFGLPVAIFVSGTLFALVHLDFTPVLWPYYVSVAALYGTVTYLTQSILPTVALHTAGNLYSNFDLLLHGRAEWQTPEQGALLIWETGADSAFWLSCAALAALMVAACWAFRRLAYWSRARSSS